MVVCASCGAESPDGFRHCGFCGAQLEAPAPAREQRKTVTVLFSDVVGSTALGERLDAETVRQLMTRYFERSREVIERHGGTVEKFIGDAVMAVFGVPVAHEDDALRAVRAAFELREAVESFNPELERAHGTRLELRIGVNTGEVVAGAEEWLVTGDAVNVAARLQQTAGPGETLIGATTWALVRDAVTIEELEPLALKGKAKPLLAYRVTGLCDDGRRGPRRLDVPMLGRARERKLLDEAFEETVRRRTCSLVTVVGAAGVGKSRLSHEFLADVDALVVEGRSLSYGDGITYWSVIEVVRQLPAAREALREASPAAADSLRALLTEIEAVMTPPEIASSVCRLLELAAREYPLVVVFDDIQWGEDIFLDLILHLAERAQEAPILLLCLARPELVERRPDWAAGVPGATTATLEPLDQGTTDTLIEHILGGFELEDGLVGRIRVASAGNPLFVEEMLAMAQESGGEAVEVPPTIGALLASRLDQLTARERSVLERGSIEGELFHQGVVEALSSPPGPVDSELDALVRKDLVRPDRPQRSGAAYSFRHLLIRDAAYESLTKGQRAALHERFAGWLAESGWELVDEIIGYHLEQAYRYQSQLGAADDELGARAGEMLARAARAARQRGDYLAAAGLFARAAELGRAGRPALLPDLAELLVWRGELDEAKTLLEEAVADAQAAGDAALEAHVSLALAEMTVFYGEGSIDG